MANNMTNKVQKIREEVKKLHGNPYYMMAVKDVLAIIDSLQEERVREELEDTTQTITYKGEVYIRCYKDKLDAFACKYPMSVPKTSKKYAKYSDVDLTIAVKEGAKWQKEKMMANAIGGTVQEDYQIIMDDGTYIDLDPSMSLKPSLAVKEGERIKVIVIKED